CAHTAPKTKTVISKEGESATLTCLYKSSSSRVLLFWGRLMPRQTPEFLLLKGARSETCFQSISPRYDSATSKTSTFLIINNLKLEDKASY
uniref:T-cell receptor alpha/delta variable 21.0 n=1 Tax=Cyprinus carpio TaxID=7962 RepID=A0A8C1JTY5_CYPCA